MNLDNKKFLVCGAGGFIGGHLVKDLLKDGYEVVCVDNKPYDHWFQFFKDCKNYSLDLKNYDNCLKITKGINFVFNMACNMGGMGFIEKIRLSACYQF